MNVSKYTRPLPVREVKVLDAFWANYQQKILEKVIPYQWEALNDRIEDADKSYCIQNFEIAAGRKEGKHQGCVFQDSDLAKWLEAVAYALAIKPDPELEKTADAAIELVCAAQQPDGYCNTFYIINGLDKRFTNLKDNHELYCFGHMLEAAVAYYEATGKDALLNAMIRYADCIDRCIGPEEGKIHGYPGHEVAEMALIRLYEITREERHLRLAKYFIDQRGQQPLFFEKEDERHGNQFWWKYSSFRYQYYQAGRPVREQHDAEGHAVRAAYLYSGMADVARVTGDDSLYEATRKLWESIAYRRMYITGAIGSSEYGESFSFDYDLPNDTIYGETCAAIALVFFARRMLEIEPRAEYADVMERALYNGVISGMSLDGRHFFYVNPLEVLPQASREDNHKRHVRPVRQKWFGCACCPPNLARLLASIGGYAYTQREDALYVHLYMASEFAAKLGGNELGLKVEAGFPWKGDVQLTVRSGVADGTIALRAPGWCRKWTLKVNGEAVQPEMENGYMLLSRSWRTGDQIALSFDMPVTLMEANPSVREDAGKVAVMRGPVVYCMEEADNGARLHRLHLGADAAFAERYTEELDGIVRISATGTKETETWETDVLYRPRAEKAAEPCDLALIPYYAWANRGEGEMMVWIHT